MADWYHVSSSRNRESISRHGLDSKRMLKAARGIAGSLAPEREGCFLCRDQGEVEWFVGMNNTGGPVDVWAVAGVDEGSLRESPEGHLFDPRPIAAERLRLIRCDIQPMDVSTVEDVAGGPEGSLSVVFRRGFKPDQR